MFFYVTVQNFHSQHHHPHTRTGLIKLCRPGGGVGIGGELASVRTADVTVIKSEHSGIMVKAEAMRIVEGKTGVYVVSGLEAKFVEADIIFSGDDYHICAPNTSDSSKLRLYDKIIVKGRNLYDGKIIY